MKKNKLELFIIFISLFIIIALGLTMLILHGGKTEETNETGETVEYGADTPEKAIEKMLSAIADHDGMSLESAMVPEKYIAEYDHEVKEKYGMTFREFLSENVGSKYDEQKAKISNVKTDLDDPVAGEDLEEMKKMVKEVYGIDLQHEDNVLWYDVRYDVTGVWRYREFGQRNNDSSEDLENGIDMGLELMVYQVDGKYYVVDPFFVETS